MGLAEQELAGLPRPSLSTLTKCRGSSETGVESMNFFRSWLRNSNTRYSFFSLCTTSSSLGRDTSQDVAPRTGTGPASPPPSPPHLTMLGCLSSLSREISLMAVLGTPSVSLQERRVQQWGQGAKKGASALRAVTCLPYFIRMAHPSALGRCASRTHYYHEAWGSLVGVRTREGCTFVTTSV